MTLQRPGTSPDLILPRFGTARNLSRATYGHEVAEVAKRLGKPLMPWQRYAADVALEIDPDTGDLFYEEVDITVPRQSGKTTLILALLVWRCITMTRRLGEAQTATYLAQSGKMARRKLEREFAKILRTASSLKETPHPRSRPVRVNEWKLSMNNGSEHILFGTGSYLQIEAPTETGSHGDVLDMPVIDEAFAHQGDAVEQAVDAASVTRRSPQLYVISTAGNGRSRYLWGKVKAGRNAVDNPDSRTCYLEWSLPEDCSPSDEDAWHEYLPALGHTITLTRLRAKLEKAMRGEVDSEDIVLDDDGKPKPPEEPAIDGFRRGYLNQWPEIPSDGDAPQDAKIPAEAWRYTVREQASKPAKGACTLAYDVSRDGEIASIVLAWGSQGSPHIQQLRHEHGVGWLPSALVGLVQEWEPLALGCYGSGPAGAQVGPIMLALSEATVKTELQQLGSITYRQACGAFYSDVVEGRLIRPPVLLGPLDNAAANATERKMGETWAWDIRNATVPISPLVAATVARALLPVEAPKPPHKAVVYSW